MKIIKKINEFMNKEGGKLIIYNKKTGTIREITTRRKHWFLLAIFLILIILYVLK